MHPGAANQPRARVWRWLLPGALLLMGSVPARSVRADDLAIYFQGLRDRGLFVVADQYARTRLADPKLDAGRRADLVVEWSRTLAAQAETLTGRQRDELWESAGQILQEELTKNASRRLLLSAQQAFLTGTRAQALRWDREVAPENGPLEKNWLQQLSEALTRLETCAKELEELLKSGRRTADGLELHQMRALFAGVEVERGELLRDRAAKSRERNADRAADLLAAKEAFERGRTLAMEPALDGRCELGLADIRRLQGEPGPARETFLAVAAREPNGSAIQNGAIAGVVRCRLDENKPLEAAEYLLSVRQSRPALAGELWFLQLQTLLALRDRLPAEKAGDVPLNLEGEAQLVLQRVAEQVGGAWTRRCQELWQRDQSRRTYGPELDTAIRAAQAAAQGGDLASAVEAYARAITLAEQARQRDLARELANTRGALLLEGNRFEEAAEQFRHLAETGITADESAPAHLLQAFALGRLYQAEPTQSRRLKYTAELEALLAKSPEHPTADDARFMLGQLQEQRLQLTQALPLYTAITPGYARYAAATLAVARCYEGLARRLLVLERDPQPLLAQGVTELQRRLDAGAATAWSVDQAQAALLAIRLAVMRRPIDVDAARRMLDRLQPLAVSRARTEQDAAWKRIVDELGPLQVVLLAASGRSREARELLSSSKDQSPGRALSMVLALDQLTRGPDSPQQVDLTELFVEAATRATPLRETLTPAEQREFDLAHARALLITGRVTDGLVIIERLEQQATGDPERLRVLARLVSAIESPPAQVLVLRLWRTAEQRERAGSPAWLQARVGVITALAATGQANEALRLLQLTKLLYPTDADAGVAASLQSLERRLQPMDVPPKGR